MGFLETFALELVGMLALLACSAFFSGSETALFSLHREQRRQLEERRTMLHQAVLALSGDRQGVLATVLFGNMVVNTLYFSMSYLLAVRTGRQFSPTYGAILGVASFIVLVIFGEVMPKGIAVRRPLACSLVAALPLLAIAKLISPIRVALTRLMRWATSLFEPRPEDHSAITTAELKMLLELSEKQGLLDRNAGRMMREVVAFGEVMVKDIMVPRVDMDTFDLAQPREALIELVRRRRHAHLPAYEGTIDNIVGVVHARDVLLHPEAPLREFVRPVTFVPRTKTVESMLRDFREQHQKRAIVVDEYGGTAGMLTLEDILEQVVGEIEDEHARARPAVVPLGDNTFSVAAELGVSDWAEFFPIVLDPSRAETVGGFVTSLLGRWPRPGDAVVYRRMRFTVEKMRGLRLDRIGVEAEPAPPAEANESGHD